MERGMLHEVVAPESSTLIFIEDHTFIVPDQMRHLFVIPALLLALTTVGQRSMAEKEHVRTLRGLTLEDIKRRKIDASQVEHLFLFDLPDCTFPGPIVDVYPNLASLYIAGRPVKDKKDDEARLPARLHVDPLGLQRMTKLKHLMVSFFDLDGSLEALFQLPGLQGLSIGYCNLDSLPSCISDLAQLEVLDLSNNYLTGLPESLADMSSLQVLCVRYNHLRSIPPVCAELKALRKLDLCNPTPEESHQLSWNWPYPECVNHIDWEVDTTVLGKLFSSAQLERINLPRDECGDPMYLNRVFPARPWSIKVRWDMKPEPCPDLWPQRAFKRFPVPLKKQIDHGKCLCGLKGY